MGKGVRWGMGGQEDGCHLNFCWVDGSPQGHTQSRSICTPITSHVERRHFHNRSLFTKNQLQSLFQLINCKAKVNSHTVYLLQNKDISHCRSTYCMPYKQNFQSKSLYIGIEPKFSVKVAVLYNVHICILYMPQDQHFQNIVIIRYTCALEPYTAVVQSLYMQCTVHVERTFQ